MKSSEKLQSGAGWHLAVEVLVALAAISVLVIRLRMMLVDGTTTLIHDNIYWNYPVFQFFAENIMRGDFPFWNPFSNGGEPFYPLLGQLRFLEPVTIAVIAVGKFFTGDIVILFNWTRVIQSLFLVLGVYLVLRPVAATLFVRLTLIPIMLYSSFMLGSFRQDAIVNQFMWVPFVIYFLQRILVFRDGRLCNYLMAGALAGLSWQSYFFSGVWIFLFIYFVGVLCFRRELLLEAARTRGFFLKLSLTAVVVLGMMAPNVVLMMEKDRFAFPARMREDDIVRKQKKIGVGPLQYEVAGKGERTETNILMPYRFIAHAGTFSSVWDFLQIISPEGSRHVKWFEMNAWGNPSEAYMYLGVLPWAVALLGLVSGRHDMKRVWFLLLVVMGGFMLGPPGGVHRLLYGICPPTWFVRNTHAFVLFFVFGLLYFYVLGLNRLCESGKPLFRDDGGKGPFGRFGLSPANARDIALIFLSGVILLSFKWMASIAPHQSHALYPLILAIAAFVWFFRKDLGDGGVFGLFIVNHLVLVFMHTTNPKYFTRCVVMTLVVPLALLIWNKRNEGFRPSRGFLAVVFACALVGDLTHSLGKSHFLYEQQISPKYALGVDTRPKDPASPDERVPHVTAGWFGGQSLRYLPLLFRVPAAFSSVYWDREPKDIDIRRSFERPQRAGYTFKDAYTGKRWSSFLLLKSYYRLLNSGLPASALEEMFAIDVPAFQFKRDGRRMTEEGACEFLAGLNEGEIREFFRTEIILPSDVPEGAEPEGGDADAPVVTGDFGFKVGDYDYDAIEVDLQAPAAGFLYWADGFDPAWRAFVSGREVPVLRANMNFKAVRIPAGSSRVRFEYDPCRFRWALMLFYGLWISAVLAAAVGSVISVRAEPGSVKPHP